MSKGWGRGGSAGPCGAVPLCSARPQAAALPPAGRVPARGRGMSQSPPSPRRARTPARWLRGAARQCAHMDAAPLRSHGRAQGEPRSISVRTPPLFPPSPLRSQRGQEGKEQAATGKSTRPANKQKRGD